MIKLSKEQQIIAVAGAGLGTLALTATGFAIRSVGKSKEALKEAKNIKKMKKTIDELTAKVAEMNQVKMNEEKLNKLERELDIIKSRNHDKVVKEVLKQVKQENENEDENNK